MMTIIFCIFDWLVYQQQQERSGILLAVESIENIPDEDFSIKSDTSGP